MTNKFVISGSIIQDYPRQRFARLVRRGLPDSNVIAERDKICFARICSVPSPTGIRIKRGREPRREKERERERHKTILIWEVRYEETASDREQVYLPEALLGEAQKC